MKPGSGRLALALSVPLLVIPLALLTWLATRSLDQQESGMRARLRESLFLEVSQTNGRIHEWLSGIPSRLAASAPRSGTLVQPTHRELAQWEESDALVGIPFLINPSGAIDYPAKETKLFYWRYLNVFGNVEPIPVYKSIAQEYETSIVSMQQKKIEPSISESVRAIPELRLSDFADTDYRDESAEAESTTEEAGAREARIPTEPIQRAEKAERAPAARSKVAQSLFETDTEVQKHVYEKAAEEGKETLTRNVNPVIDVLNTRETLPARSVYIETDSYFRDLVASADSGLLPRIFDNEFVLLYWEKRGDWIVGCELDMETVKESIMPLAGNPADSVRFLAVLDHTGTPIISLDKVKEEEWRRPLLASEISTLLPYWETAVILTDPSAFENRVRASRYALGALVITLVLAISGSVLFLLRYSSNRLLEARQRVNFVTTVTHELKTPLTSIRMYSEMLAEGADADPRKRQKYLDRIVGECARLTSLINDVLDVAKLERKKAKATIETFDVTGLARDTLDMNADRLKKEGFALGFSAEARSLWVSADREAVIRILDNLLSNAEKYSAGVRNIHITVGSDRRKRAAFISVSDRGIGIPIAHRKRIFKEFYRVDTRLTAEKSGTGLGLAIARSLARCSGGDLRYAPRESADYTKGSVFTLRLPLVEES